jgi:hypothetical protein
MMSGLAFVAFNRLLERAINDDGWGMQHEWDRALVAKAEKDASWKTWLRWMDNIKNDLKDIG